MRPWILLAIALAACAPRAKPYRFRGPILGGVSADPSWEGTSTSSGASWEETGASVETDAATAVRQVLVSLVGERTDESAIAFALRAVRRAGVSIPDFADAATLRARAEAAGAFSVDAAPNPGDLVLFGGGRVVGVVASRSETGTVEIVYARRVIRRGFVTRGRPHDRRDAEGRVLNTFVLPSSRDDRTAEKHLAGELLDGFIAVRAL